MSKHQIITVGKDINTVYAGIKEFSPDYLHFLITQQTRAVYEPLLAMLPESISYECRFVKPYEAESVQAACRRIHTDFTGEFSYNLTEGTKVMAIAALEVAREMQARAFYLTQEGGRIDLLSFARQPLANDLDSKEIIRLSGNVLGTYGDVAFLSAKDIVTAFAIKKFAETFSEEFKAVQHYFTYRCKRHLTLLPASFSLSHDLRVRVGDGALRISRCGRPILAIDRPNAAFLFFGGRWWEIAVASQVKIWCERQEKKPDAWNSVIFSAGSKSDRVKNEVDILVNNHGRFLFIECKSGFITQEDIYKIDAVRETYGGDRARAALASYYPVSELLKEKCADLQIHVFAPDCFAGRLDFVHTLPQWLDAVTQKDELY